jgi:hypothetical protein
MPPFLRSGVVAPNHHALLFSSDTSDFTVEVLSLEAHAATHPAEQQPSNARRDAGICTVDPLAAIAWTSRLEYGLG